MPAPPHRILDGRAVINRVEIRRRTGAGESTVRYWHTHRGENGHPEVAARLEGTDYFDEAAWAAWWQAFQARKKAGVTRLDDSGDPDELIGTAEVARILGYAGSHVILEYLRRHPGYFPEPDELTHDPAGRAYRSWHRQTVWTWARGRGTRTSGRPPARRRATPPPPEHPDDTSPSPTY